MTAQVIDLMNVRLARLATALIREDIHALHRTTIKEGPCRECSGAGLLQWCNGVKEPVFHDFNDCHKVDRSKVHWCRVCGGTGAEYREILAIGEVG